MSDFFAHEERLSFPNDREMGRAGHTDLSEDGETLSQMFPPESKGKNLMHIVHTELTNLRDQIAYSIMRFGELSLSADDHRKYPITSEAILRQYGPTLRRTGQSHELVSSESRKQAGK